MALKGRSTIAGRFQGNGHKTFYDAFHAGGGGAGGACGGGATASPWAEA
jgi:hypothetical protein